jgi:nicotinamidase-related amidase
LFLQTVTAEMNPSSLPIPPHYDADRVSEIWNVEYQETARRARKWALDHNVSSAASDRLRVCLIAIDIQNTFCIPGFELFVQGRSGNGAVEDNQRLCEFIYRNLHCITTVTPTLDTHQLMQIFHPNFLIDDQGSHPEPFTQVSADEIQSGRWRINPKVCSALGISQEYGERHLDHYVQALATGGRHNLTVWPYHAMLGGIGHALVPAVEEAIFFHAVARSTQPDLCLKGLNPLTEHYSALQPEVLTGPDGDSIASRDSDLLNTLWLYDAVFVAGQAKSHCVASTITDLLDSARTTDRDLASKVYLLKDCMSPVVLPGVVDFTDHANEVFEEFSAAGMHVVRSTDPLSEWPELEL